MLVKGIEFRKKTNYHTLGRWINMTNNCLEISILNIFPDMFKGPFSESILKRAQEKGLIK